MSLKCKFCGTTAGISVYRKLIDGNTDKVVFFEGIKPHYCKPYKVTPVNLKYKYKHRYEKYIKYKSFREKLIVGNSESSKLDFDKRLFVAPTINMYLDGRHLELKYSKRLQIYYGVSKFSVYCICVFYSRLGTDSVVAHVVSKESLRVLLGHINEVPEFIEQETLQIIN
jgi:hypothetical protein